MARAPRAFAPAAADAGAAPGGAGTPNRLEYDLGFFVKNGDGAADVKPIAELYKTQVYELAAALGIPEEIRRRTPTTDTYPLAQDQEEFYFSLPYRGMDLAVYARTNGYPPESLAAAIGVSTDDATRVYADIDSKRRIGEILKSPGTRREAADLTVSDRSR